jgi:hypothetical protein
MLLYVFFGFVNIFMAYILCHFVLEKFIYNTELIYSVSCCNTEL